jgi:hypothetical protein
MKIENYVEIIANLKEIKNNQAIFTFTIEFPLETIQDLKKFVGKKIGIFNCDGEYKISLVEK